MVALVDRFEERFEMLGGQRFFRGRHQHKRQGRSPEAEFQ
jgi:hypothetical protein